MDRVQRALITNIKSTRRAAGLSQMKLSGLSDLSTSLIAEIQGDRKFPSSASIGKIAQALSLRPYQLFLDEED